MHISKVLYAGCSVCVLWVDGEVESDLLYSQRTHFTKSTLDHNGSGVGWGRTNSGKGKVTVKYAVFFTIPKIWRYGLKFCYFITTVCNTNPAFMSCVSENQCYVYWDWDDDDLKVTLPKQHTPTKYFYCYLIFMPCLLLGSNHKKFLPSL